MPTRGARNTVPSLLNIAVAEISPRDSAIQDPPAKPGRRGMREVSLEEHPIGRPQRLQQQLGSAWKRHLADWLSTSGGFIQYGQRGPAVDLLPPQAVEWLINCRNPAAQEWIFVGRWLSLSKAEDAAILTDMRQVVAAVEDTFAALFPLWGAIYT